MKSPYPLPPRSLTALHDQIHTFKRGAMMGIGRGRSNGSKQKRRLFLQQIIECCGCVRSVRRVLAGAGSMAIWDDSIMV